MRNFSYYEAKKFLEDVSKKDDNEIEVQDAIDDASGGDTIELTGEYKGNGKDITINNIFFKLNIIY